jgi:hypothetical protein
VYSSLFEFRGDLTLISHVPEKNTKVIPVSLKDHSNCCNYSSAKDGVDVGRMARQHAGETRRCPIRLF